MANSAAILTDAFPSDQRGFALGINQIAALAGQFIGLVAGGLLAALDWRAVFWINVPVGIYGTVWAYRKLRDNGERHRGRDRLVGQHHLRRRPERGPDRHHRGHPAVRASQHGLDQPRRGRPADRRGRAARGVRGHREPDRRADVPAQPVPDQGLHRGQRRRASAVAIARGGLQFMLIIWLQGIWLPLHGLRLPPRRRCGPASSCSR